ncbi:chaplin family protein [Streptosporangium sp. NPDC051022]|uniref:chaplin family protein n=1 Tax=Streptosporangium sp. NPDC051022 TaxID=3155752 RepID=UPI0034217D18
MRTWVKGTAPAALLALGVMSLGSGTAFADTSGDHSVAGGNQVNLPISLPIDISGNSAAVGGHARGSSEGGASVEDTGPSGGSSGVPGRTSGNGSVLGGNQVNAPIDLPVNACGNGLAVLGGSEAGCKGGASVRRSGSGGGSGGNRTSGDHSVLGGNQVNAPIKAPINLCGNAAAIFGGAVAGCKGGASVSGPAGGGRGAGGNTTSGRGSVGGGNQVVAPITAPINVCGNTAAVFGGAFSGCKGGAEVPGTPGRPGRPGGPGWPGKPGYPGGHPGGHSGGHGPRPGGQPGAGGNITSGNWSVLGGNQVVAPITAPLNVCGNAVGNADADCKGGASIEGGGAGTGRGAGGNITSGRPSVAGGNQVVAPVNAPVNVCGNAVALFGGAFAGCKGGASVSGPAGGGRGAGGNTTSGNWSVAGGNQVVAPITAPVNVCGNAVAVLGDAAAGCLGGSHAGGSAAARRGLRDARWTGAAAKHRTSGLMSTLPVVPDLNRMKGAGARPRPAGASDVRSLPLVQGARDLAGLPELPELPVSSGLPKTSDLTGGSGLSGVASGIQGSGIQGSGAQSRGARGRGVQGRGAQSAPRKPDSVLAPATGLLSSTPAGGALPAKGGLPVDTSLPVGLMSAAQPIGVTGMNSGSLFALLLGAMAAASATLFVTARRIRFAKK